VNLDRGWWSRHFAPFNNHEAICSDQGSLPYGELIDRVNDWHQRLDAQGVVGGQVAVFRGAEWSRLVPLFLALIEKATVAVPLLSASHTQQEEFIEIANADVVIDTDAGTGDQVHFRPPAMPAHPLLEQLRARRHPGLILFSSGSTGKSKAILHDLTLMLRKYQGNRPSNRIICFLLLDHIGGVNTLFHTLAHGGTIIPVADRSPAAVCRTIEDHGAEILPTSPSFLNLLLLSGAHRDHDLGTLRMITYGTELMPATTLKRLREALPTVDLRQTYGLSEVGILQSKSRPDGSLWVRVGGDGYETKIVDGVLWIRATSAMMGYLNAPSAFDAEGWFNTEDMVEQEGEWLRFLGRCSEIINTGGLKVYPAEVEAVLLDMPGVLDATVRGQPNELLGQIVSARVTLATPESPALFKARMRNFCRGIIPQHMVPARVEVVDKVQHNERFKRIRLPP
jgi:acyl-coenzyme A synthetase/AMP-(fatty) acid ligase